MLIRLGNYYFHRLYDNIQESFLPVPIAKQSHTIVRLPILQQQMGNDLCPSLVALALPFLDPPGVDVVHALKKITTVAGVIRSRTGKPSPTS